MKKQYSQYKRLIISVIIFLIIVSGTFIWSNYEEFIHKIKYFTYKIESQFSSKNNLSSFHIGNYQIVGIDVSRHQGRINWEKLIVINENNKHPISFAYIKATEGANLVDKYFEENWSEANRLGILCGAYLYYRPEVNSLLQFNNFKKMVKLGAGHLPPVLDIEEDRGDIAFTTYLDGIYHLLKLLKNEYGINPIIYASPKYYSLFLNNSKFNKFPLWLAYYGDFVPPSYFDKWTFWQYTNKGRLPGIYNDVDLNVFRGNKLHLQEFIIK